MDKSHVFSKIQRDFVNLEALILPPLINYIGLIVFLLYFQEIFNPGRKMLELMNKKEPFDPYTPPPSPRSLRRRSLTLLRGDDLEKYFEAETHGNSSL